MNMIKNNLAKYKNIMISDVDFLQKGGADIIENDSYWKATIYVLYSIYLYYKYKNKVDLDTIKTYIYEMELYAFRGKTYAYHTINVTKMKIENDYELPFYYNLIANLDDKEHAYNVFIGLSAFMQSENALSQVLEEFSNEF